MAGKWHQANSEFSNAKSSTTDQPSHLSFNAALLNAGQVDASPVGVMFLFGLISACLALIFNGTLAWFFSTITVVLLLGLLKEKYRAHDKVTFVADLTAPEETESDHRSGNQTAL